MILCKEGKVKNLSWQIVSFSCLSQNYQLLSAHELLVLEARLPKMMILCNYFYGV